MTATKGGLVGAIESKEQDKRSAGDYKRFVRDHYDGPAGAFTAVTGLVTGHEALAGKLIRPGQFDVTCLVVRRRDPVRDLGRICCRTRKVPVMPLGGPD